MSRSGQRVRVTVTADDEIGTILFDLRDFAGDETLERKSSRNGCSAYATAALIAAGSRDNAGFRYARSKFMNAPGTVPPECRMNRFKSAEFAD